MGDRMNIFDLREQLVRVYGDFIRGFLKIGDPGLDAFVRAELDRGVLWPEPWISLNPSFEPGGHIDSLVDEGVLEVPCREIFPIKSDTDPVGRPLRLHRHQAESIEAAACGDNYVVTTGTGSGSGKSLSYIVPIVNRVLGIALGMASPAVRATSSHRDSWVIGSGSTDASSTATVCSLGGSGSV